MANTPKSNPASGTVVEALSFECPQQLADGTVCGQHAALHKEIPTAPLLYHCECPQGHKFHRPFTVHPSLTLPDAWRPCDCIGKEWT